MANTILPDALKKVLDYFPSTLSVCLLFGKNGKVEYFNQRFKTFFNCSDSELYGKPLSKLLASMGVKHTEFILHNPPDGEARTFTFNERTFVCFKKAVRDGDFGLKLPEIYHVFFWCEIPYQQGERYELLMHELEIILDSIHDGIWIIDGNGITLHVNKSLKRITGISPKDVVGKHVTVPMTEGKFTNCVTLDALKQKKTVTQFDDYLNGKRCLNTSSPILNEKGEVRRVVASIRDLSELESLQEKLAKAELEAMKYKNQLEKQGNKTFLGTSTLFQNCVKQLLKVAKSPSCVLIMGETGTGKSMAASFIHENSDRKNNAFISINCAAIAESLIDSELFGYQKGAFTGADQAGKKGYFELADGGTLLLDEIGELPLAMQAKLLHVLDNYSFHRVGGNAPIKVNVRIVAATNRPLEELVQKGEFRKDLYYRLHVLTVNIPPLRDRLEDVPVLANAFLADACNRLGTVKNFHKKALSVLATNQWQGNVRELRGAVEYLVAMSEGNVIKIEDLQPYLTGKNEGIEQDINEQGSQTIITEQNLNNAVFELERKMIKEALVLEGSSYKAAVRLGVSQSTVVRKAKALGIKI